MLSEITWKGRGRQNTYFLIWSKPNEIGCKVALSLLFLNFVRAGCLLHLLGEKRRNSISHLSNFLSSSNPLFSPISPKYFNIRNILTYKSNPHYECCWYHFESNTKQDLSFVFRGKYLSLSILCPIKDSRVCRLEWSDINVSLITLLKVNRNLQEIWEERKVCLNKFPYFPWDNFGWSTLIMNGVGLLLVSDLSGYDCE